MKSRAHATPDERDRTLGRLRRLTAGVAGAAAGAVAFFAIVAASTIPGRTAGQAQSASSQSSASQQTSSETTTSPAINSATPSTSHAVSGGS